jgi:hypothetical protein
LTNKTRARGEKGKIDHGYEELASILRPAKRRVFIFLYLHQTNNRLENISNFHLPLLNSAAKKSS